MQIHTPCFDKLEAERKLTLIVSMLGFFQYIAFILLDLVVYPDYFVELSIIRAIVLLWLLTMGGLYLFDIINDLYPFSIIVPAAFGISLMCYTTGDGFASIYFVGNFLVIITASIFIKMETKMYAFLMLFVVLQHFFLQFFLPYTIESLFVNIFFLVSAILLSITINFAVNNMSSEIKTLRGLLPICMYCKKIRTDAGAWDKIELYIKNRADVDFSHGICPSCLAQNYPDDEDENADEILHEKPLIELVK